MSLLQKIRPDKFTVALVSTVVVASLLPLQGQAAHWFGIATQIAVAMLFFMHGVNLPSEALLRGLTHWRLHLLVLLSTYVLFPALGLAVQLLPASILSPPLAMGILYLCCLPSTVQSSIAFTSIARGNVPAAICSASLSNILGVFVTPLMVSLLLSAKGTVSLEQVEGIVLQILVPFGVGQALHSRLGGWVKRHKPVLGLFDRGSILMVVYSAFSEAVVRGLWHQMPAESLAVMVAINLALLAVVLWSTAHMGRLAHFTIADRITLVFCGSKKSLVSGVPMANILFPAAIVGPVLLPLMLFHQIQLMACAFLARRYASRPEENDAAAERDPSTSLGMTMKTIACHPDERSEEGSRAPV
jgi:sodium/bile acid cotransporter 7